MPSYTLELELLGVYSVDMPGFEIWTDGTQEGATYSISNTGTSISITVNYGGTLPTSLEFRFNDASGEGGRTIEIQSVKINDKYVNVGNYLSSNSLVNGGSSTVDVANSSFFYDSSEPGAAVFTPATQTFTGGNDWYRDNNNTTDTFDMLGGRDVAYLGGGNDTVSGGAGNDYLRGGAGDDLLYGAADNDRLMGEDGNDTLYGGTGNDFVFGGNDDDEIHGNDGNDRLHGQNGDDVITGGLGDDVLTGGTGTNFLFGEEGDDILLGGSGVDTLDGGADDDILYGGGGNDFLDGGDGNDTLVGDTGDDVLNGNDGNDILNGRDDNDELNGGNGNDVLTGENGADVLNGDAGNDTLIGGDGADTLNGGDGNDIIHGSGLTATEIATILNANPNVIYSAATNSFYQFVASGITWTAAQTAASGTMLSGVAGHLATVTTLTELNFLDSQINPTNDANSGSYFTSGNEVAVLNEWRYTDGIEAGIQFWQGDFSGSAVNGFDTMWEPTQPNSAAQNYVYLWSAGDGLADAANSSTFAHHDGYLIEWDAGLISDDLSVDTINGGAGNDHIYGYGGNDVLSGGDDIDLLFGGDGNDTLNGDAGNDILIGDIGNDTLNGGTGDDTLNGGAGDDTLNGGADNDILNGDAGDDTLNGDAGNDTITANDGADIVDGGAGDDTIIGGDQTTIAVNATTLLTYGGGQDTGGAVNYMDDDVGVELDGNLWKQFSLNYTVTANTVIEFDFRSTNEAEISGIGFDTDNNISNNRTFKVYGTQNWGINNFDNYDGSGNWTHYEINVGAFYTGNFTRLFLVNDDDGGGDDGEGYWRNIIIHEGDEGGNDITGGDGADELYGDSGLDTFIFEDTNDVDTIHYFNEQDGDILDISNILTNYVGGVSDIDDYVNFTNNGDHVTMSVDVNGTTGGANFVDIADLRGMADLDEATLLTNGNIVA